MKKTLNTLLLLSLVACHSKGKSDNNPIPPVQSPEPVTIPAAEPNVVSSTLDVQVTRKVTYDDEKKNASEFKENINTYKINMKPKGGYFTDMEVSCSQSTVRAVVFRSQFDEEGDESEVEVVVPVEGPNKVKFVCVVKENEIVRASAEIYLKKSLIVSATVNFTTLGLDQEKIETLYLDKDAVLVTAGASVKIEAQEIISEGAKLITFSDEALAAAAPMTALGLSGGKIEVEAEQAFGKLLVELRGTNAGAVSNIPQPKAVPRPVNPSLNTRCESMHENDAYHYKTIERCRGKNGGKGFEGVMGLPGHKGGDSGTLLFKTISKSDLILAVKYLPGLGSVGGQGGEGGDGERGGIGARVNIIEHNSPHLKSFGYSYTFPNGSNGPQGDRGPNGPRGIDGSKETSKIECDGQLEEISESKTFNE